MKGSIKMSATTEDFPILGLLQDAVLSLCRRNCPKTLGLEVDAIICISMLSSSQHHVVKIHEKIGADDETHPVITNPDGNTDDFDIDNCDEVIESDSVSPSVTEMCSDVRIILPIIPNIATKKKNFNFPNELHQNSDIENDTETLNYKQPNCIVKSEPTGFRTDCKLKNSKTKTGTNVFRSCNEMDQSEDWDLGASQSSVPQKDTNGKINDSISTHFSSDQSDQSDIVESRMNSELIDQVDGIVIKQEPLFETELNNPLALISNQTLEFHDISNIENNHYIEVEKSHLEKINSNRGKKRRISRSDQHVRGEHIRKYPALSLHNEQNDEKVLHGTVYSSSQNNSEIHYTSIPDENFNCNTDSDFSQIIAQDISVGERFLSDDISEEPTNASIQSSVSGSVSETQWFNHNSSKMMGWEPHKKSMTQQTPGYAIKGKSMYSNSKSKLVHQKRADLKRLPPSVNFSSNFPTYSSTEITHNDISNVADVFDGCSSQVTKLNMSDQKSDHFIETGQSVFAKPLSKLTLATLFSKNLPLKEKKYFCQNCGAGFTELYNKMRHEKTTCGVMCYKCKICNHTFSRSDSMSRHMFHVHGVKKSPFNGNIPVT